MTNRKDDEMQKIWSTRGIVVGDFPDDVQKQVLDADISFGACEWRLGEVNLLLSVMRVKMKREWTMRLFAPRPMFFFDTESGTCVKQGWAVNLEAPSFFEYKAISGRFYLHDAPQPKLDVVVRAKLVGIHIMAMRVIRNEFPWVEEGYLRAALLIALGRAREDVSLVDVPNGGTLITDVPDHGVG